jgi:hypothetical protein
MKRSKSLLGEEKAEATKPHGYGTKVSEYTEDPTPKRCDTCKYFKSPGLCNNKVVARDPKVKTDRESGLKIVKPELCCRFWWPKGK